MLFDAYNRRAKRPAIYAQASDFAEIFLRDTASLFCLALLLTGNHSDAERCFLSALSCFSDESTVVNNWAGSWCRRCVVKSAIEMMSPVYAKHLTFAHIRDQQGTDSEGGYLLHGVINLQVFDRFAFVMTVLERFSDCECSVLLKCTPRDIVDARISALKQMAMFNEIRSVAGSA